MTAWSAWQILEVVCSGTWLKGPAGPSARSKSLANVGMATAATDLAVSAGLLKSAGPTWRRRVLFVCLFPGTPRLLAGQDRKGDSAKA